MNIRFVAACCLTVAALSTSAAPAPLVSDFDVYIDPPTAFVFVKLPQGWKFVGQADAVRLERLPRHVHTRLLASEPGHDAHD